MSGYGQFCPVAKAMEVLDERWTLLIVRELLYGSTRFNELRRGVPRMSPTLLSKRLRSLERVGVIRREELNGHAIYTLTPSGQELRPLVEALGVWGLRWVGTLGEEDYDPHLLFWDMRRKVPVRHWPRGRTTVHFHFEDVPSPADRWWFVVSGEDVDVCDADPGFEVSVAVSTRLRDLVRVWRGDMSWPQLLAQAAIDGSSTARRSLPQWFGQSELAGVPRPVPA